MGTYGQNRFYITFDNETLAEIFELDLRAVEESADCYEYEREGNYIELFHSEQDKIVWSRNTAAEQIEKWLGTNLHLSKNLLDKCAKVVMYRFATSWFWDYVDPSKVMEMAGLNSQNVPDDLDITTMYGDWAYDSEWVYEEDCSSDYHTWDHGELKIEHPNVTDVMYREMAKSFREYYDRNK